MGWQTAQAEIWWCFDKQSSHYVHMHTHAHTQAHVHTHAEEEKKRAEETVVGGKGLITKIKFFPLCFHITTSF